MPPESLNELTTSEKGDGFFFDAFLSYSRKDGLSVRELVGRLQEKAVSAWFDEHQIDVGDTITEKIQQGLSSSRYLIVCLSRHFKDSEWCKREYNNHLVQEIKERTVRVLPVRLDDYADEDIPDFLFDKYAVDIRTEDGLSRLVRKVKTHLQIQSYGFSKFSDTGVHRIEHDKPEDEAGLEASVQLWFPHNIARSFFDITQKTDSGERLDAVGRCVDNVLGFLTILCLADYAAHHEVTDLKPLLNGLSGKALSERIELLSKMITVTAGDQVKRTFVPHLSTWALSEGHPSPHFMTFFKLALAFHAKSAGGAVAAKRTEDLLHSILGSLLWLGSYRLIVIGEIERPRPPLAKGKFRSLVGVVKGFLPESFLWQMSPRARLERGCYVINPGRTGLLRLDPFLLTREEMMASSGRTDGGDLWMFSGIDLDQIVFQDSAGVQLKFPIRRGNLFSEQSTIRRDERVIAIKLVDERLLPDLEDIEHEENALECENHEEDHTFDEDGSGPSSFKAHFIRIQKALLYLAGSFRPSDRVPVDLDGIGIDLLDAFERFPAKTEAFQEVAIEWSRYVDQALDNSTDENMRLVLESRRREVETRLADLLGGFSRSQGLFMNGVRFRADSPYASNAADIRDLEYGLKLLLGKDELDQSDGIQWLLGKGFKECESKLDDTAGSGRRDRVLDILWRRFPRVFLYYREPFWDLAKYMLKADPAKWRLRLESFRRVIEREISLEEAKLTLEELGEEDRSIIAAFLAMHPRRNCRELGMSSLKPADRWEILLSPATHATVVRELVEITCKDCPPSYIKAMFLLLRSRLRSASTPLALNHSFEFLKIFYQVPLFLEAAFFKALVTLHKDLNIQAEKSQELTEVGRRFEVYFDDFRKKVHGRDNDITDMRHIPLPIQRKLARDGYFVDIFICNVRDPIALEAVPHALRRPDVIRFFKASLVNKSALQRMADDKLVMREHSIKAALCRNPKADSKQIRSFMPQLSVPEFKLIAEDKNVSHYARSLAKQLLMLKTS
ncbi:MAG TPA: toll/interleukin-1 receptor domain-containing protein [Thermoanaerobaculia bacterium]|nr:toll/interleukin-1 receptor domain-containing protein [Thermoanaerobaculia bacterium]